MDAGKLVVLCIDDDASVVDGLAMMIESGGYARVERASSAAAGLEKLDPTDPDLIIVDLMMESLDAGVKFTTAARGRGVRVPIYMLTSVGDQVAQTLDPAAIGLNGVFQKPVEPEDLMRVVETRLTQLAG